MKFLVLGASGMAGHTIAIYLQESGHDVTTITRRPFNYCKNIERDVNDLVFLKQEISQGDYDVVINCIGILNKTAEENKDQAVFLNSYLPHILSKITQNMKTRIIHMSTDCVFSGDVGSYNENSLRDGNTFYDRTKALGELENSKDLTFRCSIIGPDINKNGIGLFNWFMAQSGEIFGYNKVFWTGVTTLTLAKAMEKAAQDNLVGLYHLVNNAKISKYDLLSLFNEQFKHGKLKMGVNDKVIIDKSLVNNRLDFKFQVPSYEQMVIEMKAWVVAHKDIYEHYQEVN
jgi:dTDP-4-dehydrorhamnose reductase